MGLAVNGKKIAGLAVNGSLIGGIAYNGQVIFRNKPPYRIVTFADGTDEEIAAMLEAHYAGKINIGDYWSVGDTRVMHLSATAKTANNTVAHVEQDMTMVIIGIDHDDLVTPIKKRTKAAITLQCREVLGKNGNIEFEYYWGKEYTSVQNSDNYSMSPLREYLNNTFVESLPSEIQPLIKEVTKLNLAYHTKTDDAPLETQDKAFLPSYPEVVGTVKNQNYIKGNDVGEYEGTQYDYFATTNNRIKCANKNGVAGTTKSDWWLRSPSSYLESTGYTWFAIFASGSAVHDNGFHNGTNWQYGLAPAFCL